MYNFIYRKSKALAKYLAARRLKAKINSFKELKCHCCVKEAATVIVMFSTERQ